MERETERAFYGQERKQDHMKKFLQLTPPITDTYKKPSNTRLKAPPVKKTRRNQDDAELFQNRIVVCATKSVTPLKLGTLKTGLLKSQTNLDTIVTRNNKVWKYGL